MFQTQTKLSNNKQPPKVPNFIEQERRTSSGWAWLAVKKPTLRIHRVLMALQRHYCAIGNGHYKLPVTEMVLLLVKHRFAYKFLKPQMSRRQLSSCMLCFVAQWLYEF